LSFSEWDEGNQPEKTCQAETAEPKKVGEQESNSEEGREAIRARRKNPQAEGTSERREIISHKCVVFG
jgi:hypothetical protein